MRHLAAGIRWIMLVSGVLTCTMLYAAIAPDAALQSNFGESLPGPLANVIVRNWGALIGLMGGMLIYGALVPSARRLALVVAGTSKLLFVVLLLTVGRVFLVQPVRVAVAIDALWVVVFATYLLGVPTAERVEA